MSTRRARFKPVLNQPARRGRPGAPDGPSAESAKDPIVTQDQLDKNAPSTPNQKTLATIKPVVLSSSAVKSPSSTDTITSDSPVVSKSTCSSDTVSNSTEANLKDKSPVKVSSSQQNRVPVASSSIQDATPTSAELPQPLSPRPSRPVSGTSESQGSLRSSSDLSLPAKTNTIARSSKDDRKETAPSVKQRRAPSSTNQRALAARRNFMKVAKDGPPARSSLTMFDLIFYNPVTNPMTNKSPPPAIKRDRQASTCSVSTIHEERLDEEKVDDVDGNQAKESEDKENKGEEEQEEEEPAVPVPRVKVGPDGRIVIDEQSLVIETTETKKTRAEMEKSEVVFDTGLSNGFYKRTKRSKDWSNRDTLKFYRALQVYGTDFSLMQVLFKDRSRKELKLKFKKEERMRIHLIDKALCCPLDFDTTELEKEAQKEEEEEEAARLAKEKEEKEKDKPKPKPVKKSYRNPCSLAQKEMSDPACPESNHVEPPPPKRKAVKKPKVKQPAIAKEPPKVGLDIFDDVVLPNDPLDPAPSTSRAPAKTKKVSAPVKRKALPRDPSLPPKKKKSKAYVFASPESDHSYAASPARSQTNGSPVVKTPNVKRRASNNNNVELQSPEYVTIDLSDHLLLTPTPTQTVILPNEFSSQYAPLRTPKTPAKLNIAQSAGIPTEFSSPSPSKAVFRVPTLSAGLPIAYGSPSGPTPNSSVPVITLPSFSAGLPMQFGSPRGPEPNNAVPVITVPTRTAGLPVKLVSPCGPAPNKAVPVITTPTRTAALPGRPSGPSPNKAVPVITLTQSPGLQTGFRSPIAPVPSKTMPVITLPPVDARHVVMPIQTRTSKVEPGSLYVLQTTDPNDPKRSVLGVYMVTNNQPKVASTPSCDPVLVVGDAAKTPSDTMSHQTIKDPVEGTVLTKL